MSSTFLQIKVKKNITTFRNRLSHNCRKSNLKSGPHSKEEYQNIIAIDNRKSVRDLLKANQKKQFNGPTRTDISKMISRKKDRLKNAKKEKTKEKLEEEIKKLIEQREQINFISTAPDKHEMFEMDMSVTSLRDDLNRSLDYGKDSLIVYNEWLNMNLPNAEIIVLANHQDQSNNHVHCNFMYSGNDNNLTNDLNESFGKSPHYLKMQKSFNEFVSKHSLMQKYDLDIVPINANGKRDYTSAAKYKLLQKRALAKSEKLVEAFKNKLLKNNKTFLGGFDTEKIVEALAKALINEKTKSIENARAPKYFSKLAEELEEVKTDAKAFVQELEQIEEDNKSKIILNEKEAGQYTKHIKKLGREKRELQVSNNTKDNKIKALEQKLALYEPENEQSNTRSGFKR